MSFAGCAGDTSFGPTVRGCRDDFDFTLKFEKLFLSIIPTSVFLATALPRLIYLSRRPVIVKGPVLRLVKSVRLSCAILFMPLWHMQLQNRVLTNHI